MRLPIALSLLALDLSAHSHVAAWSLQSHSSIIGNTAVPPTPDHCSSDPPTGGESSSPRRRQLAAFLPLLLSLPLPAQAASRAVGSGEQACREAGNCWETGEWDGAVGWQWGGKDRCDALDPLCGPDGQVREIVGRPIPTVPEAVKIRSVAAIQIEIGRDEAGVLKLGFYDTGGKEDAMAAVDQMMRFLSDEGLTASRSTQNQIGVVGDGVSLTKGGLVTGIAPRQEIELGVPSQANAYARSRGRAKAGEDFVPQPRPSALPFDTLIRPHDQAGLVSIPEKGLGYGGTGFESNDECFESSFLITADAVPAFDAKGSRRRVVGQVLDAPSMAFLERLANLPTKRGIRGVLPGQTSGPPLPKVIVRQVQVSNVSSPS